MLQSTDLKSTSMLRYSLLIATIISAAVSATEVFRSGCRNDAIFKFTSKNKKLTGVAQIVLSDTIANHLSQCGRNCIRHSQCLSFNYKISGGSGSNCQLLSAVTTTSGASYVSTTGWIHYQPITQGSPRCRLVSCSAGYVCENDCTRLQGYNCADIDECLSNPCKHGGTCNNEVNQYSCNCSPFYILPICDSNFINIAQYTTSFAETRNGELIFLDKHYLLCSSNSYMSGFRMESSGSNIRYIYKCINMKESVGSNSVKYGSYHDHGNGNTHAIDRFPVDCNTDGYVYGFQFENPGNGNGRYRYYCCTVKSAWASSVSCYSGSTTASDNGGNSNIHFLDRHEVWCNDGYALSYFKYNNVNSYTQFQLNYRCCKLY